VVTPSVPVQALDEADTEALALRREVSAAWDALGSPWIDHYRSLADAIRALRGEQPLSIGSHPR
jgi:hypothetical protein